MIRGSWLSENDGFGCGRTEGFVRKEGGCVEKRGEEAEGIERRGKGSIAQNETIRGKRIGFVHKEGGMGRDKRGRRGDGEKRKVFIGSVKFSVENV